MPNVRIPAKMCESCIYRPDNAELLANVRHRWEERGHQQCHSHIMAGEPRYDETGFDRDVWCRGFWEFDTPAKVRGFCENVPGMLEIVTAGPRERQEE